MTGREPFLRAIEAAWDDDTPRLVFADWLDEHGDPDRARFVRLQCEAYRIEYGPPFRRVDELSAKEKKRLAALTAEADALLGRHRSAWTAGLPKWASQKGEVRFERGFPLFFFITGKQLVDDGAAIRAVAPLGGFLALRLLKGREAAVFACRHLEMVTRLGLDHCQLTDDGVRALTTAGRAVPRRSRSPSSLEYAQNIVAT